MGFNSHSKKFDRWMVTQNRFRLPSKNLDRWMVIEIIWLPTIEFGKGGM